MVRHRFESLFSFVLNNSLLLVVVWFVNAGVPFSQTGPGTYYVLAALLLGKPIGILLFSTGARLFGARLPAGLPVRDIAIVGVAAAIGFTVSLFFATAAFVDGPTLAETKMGALLSFIAAPLAFLLSRSSGSRHRPMTPFGGRDSV
jgi:Na+:H+ antiporter, NhaA family